MICYLLIIILLFIIFRDYGDPFVPNNNLKFDTDDIKFFPLNDGQSGEFDYLPNSYHMKLQKEHDSSSKLIPYIYDYMGKDSHHYIFEAPVLLDEELDTLRKDGPKKSYTSMLDRPIYLPDLSRKKSHYKKLMEKDKSLIIDPLKYNFRHPDQLGNKIVYDFSNSVDLKTSLRERELRLNGFHRIMLDDKNDYKEMTFCNDIDEMGTDYPCHEHGLKFNYDLENQMRLAKNDKYSTSICCKQPL